jgi:hypothetical protein
MYGLAVADDLHGFESLLNALSPVDPEELAVVHPQSVGAVFHIITILHCRRNHHGCCMNVCM